MHVFNSLMPIFLLIALGKFLRHKRFSHDLFKDLTLLTYWIALPSLLFVKIAGTHFNGSATLRVTGVLLATTLAGTALGYLLAALLRIPRQAAGAFIQGCWRANNAFVGLPVILYALGQTHPEIETVATLSLAPLFIIYNVISILVLLGHSGTPRSPREAIGIFVRQLSRNPLLIACVAGFLVQLFRWKLPLFAERSFSALGQAALPLALLSVGGSINLSQLRGAAIPSIAASAVKVFAMPLIGFFIACHWPGITPTERTTALIFLACPTAVASYVLADFFESDKQLAARIIVVSTLLSAISLSIVLALGD